MCFSLLMHTALQNKTGASEVSADIVKHGSEGVYHLGHDAPNNYSAFAMSFLHLFGLFPHQSTQVVTVR